MTHASKPLVAPVHVSAIAPYQAGKPIEELAREFGLDPATIVKLASNENPLGMPKSAKAAMLAAAESLARYPDPNGFDLKAALAERYGVPMNWITLGNGSNDILEIAALALLEPGASAVYAQHSFAVYRLATQARGARHIVVPAVDHGHDLDAMFDAIADDTRLVFIANPNNPTGTFVPGDKVADFLERVHAAHGDRVTVVLDEAYNEYLDPELRFDSTALARQYPNLIVSRTFSKAYGLAGLRVGFSVAQPRPDRPAKPRAPAVQRQYAGASRSHRGARRCRIPRASLRFQQGRQGPVVRRVRQAESALRAQLWQLRAGSRGRRASHQS